MKIPLYPKKAQEVEPDSCSTLKWWRPAAALKGTRWRCRSAARRLVEGAEATTGGWGGGAREEGGEEGGATEGEQEERWRCGWRRGVARWI